MIIRGDTFYAINLLKPMNSRCKWRISIHYSCGKNVATLDEDDTLFQHWLQIDDFIQNCDICIANTLELRYHILVQSQHNVKLLHLKIQKWWLNVFSRRKKRSLKMYFHFIYIRNNIWNTDVYQWGIIYGALTYINELCAKAQINSIVYT